MKTPLVSITIPSIYPTNKKVKTPMPSGMAKCTPDTYAAVFKIADAVAKKGGKLILSDMFRSYKMQYDSNQDYVTGKKTAFSPPPGGSFHEAGRAFDMDLSAIHISLAEFWEIAKAAGMSPITKSPDPKLSEAWHFDCYGSHKIVYDYYIQGKGKNLKSYTAAAASAILSLGIKVDVFGAHQTEAAIQSAVIRLGKTIGDMDGLIGNQTKKALLELGITYDAAHIVDVLTKVEELIQHKFPQEFTMPAHA